MKLPGLTPQRLTPEVSTAEQEVSFSVGVLFRELMFMVQDDWGPWSSFGLLMDHLLQGGLRHKAVQDQVCSGHAGVMSVPEEAGLVVLEEVAQQLPPRGVPESSRHPFWNLSVWPV